jgi:hypothetical protein
MVGYIMRKLTVDYVMEENQLNINLRGNHLPDELYNIRNNEFVEINGVVMYRDHDDLINYKVRSILDEVMRISGSGFDDVFEIRLLDEKF